MSNGDKISARKLDITPVVSTNYRSCWNVLEKFEKDVVSAKLGQQKPIPSYAAYHRTVSSI